MNSGVLKGVAVLVASAAIFIAGYQYAAALYTKDIEEMRREYAERSQAMEEKHRAHEQKQTRERQKFCVHGIIGARQTGASNEHEHQTQFS